jgi:hypothetical protein
MLTWEGTKRVSGDPMRGDNPAERHTAEATTPQPFARKAGLGFLSRIPILKPLTTIAFCGG